MRNLLLVASHEFLQRVKKRSFLLSIVGFPLLMVFIIGLSVYTSLGAGNDLPLGYVDFSGALVSTLPPGGDDRLLEMQPYSNEAAARAALEQGQIQGYFVLEGGYQKTGQVTYYYWDAVPGGRVRTTLDENLKANLVSGLDSRVSLRLQEGTEMIQRSKDGRVEISNRDFLSLLMPFVVGFLFIISVMMTSGYLLQVVTDEKENRTMEILLTSVSPIQLIGGKAAGLIALGFTLMLTWLTTGILALVFLAPQIPDFPTVTIPWNFLGVLLLFYVPSYIVISGMMIAIGSSVTETRQGQQIAGMLNILFMLPYFLSALIISDPGSPLVTALTLFPTTAMATITMRWGVTPIPAWQLLTSWVILTLTAGLSILAAARIFRVGMLMYGQGLNWKAVWNAVRAR
jgi:ABC-2 type transport system permease protein